MTNTFGISIIPNNEEERLNALYQYQIIDADLKSSFDNLAQIIAGAFHIPMVLITLVDKEKVVTKGNAGLAELNEESRGVSLSALTILDKQVTVFENTENEPVLQQNPWITGTMALKFYAGAPIITKEGFNIGTVCILDKNRRTLSQTHKELLQRFATQVMNEIDLRVEVILKSAKLNEMIRFQDHELKKRNAQLTLAQKLAGMASWEWVLTEPEITWSPEMYRFWGFEPGEITVSLEKVASLTHPEDLPILQEAINRSLQGEPVEIEYRRFNKDGKEIPIRTKTMIMKDDEGKPVSIFGVDMDISNVRIAQNKLRLQNQELLRANAGLASFSYVASHDLKEPLRKIQAFSQRIMEIDGSNLNEKSQHYFSRIENASQRMQLLIDSMLTYSRVTELSNLHFKEVNLGTVMEEIISEMAETIAEKEATIRISEMPVIRALPDQIYQLFTNLISNSLKYARESVPAVISIRSEAIKMLSETAELASGDYWKIEVEDNGIGFKHTYENKIFEIFQRLHSKSDYEGTGIGLAICKKIVETHGGTIHASGVVGEGAVFTIYFPMLEVK